MSNESTKRPSFLFIIPSTQAGGTENYTLRFIKHTKDRFRFTVLSIKKRPGTLHSSFLQMDANVVYQSIGYLNLIKWVRVCQLIKAGSYSAVCTFNGNFGGIPLLLSRIAGVRRRIAFYRRSSPAFSQKWHNRLYHWVTGRLVLLCATNILSNSTTALQTFFSAKYLHDSRFKVIRNAIDPTIALSNRAKEECRLKLGIPLASYVIGHVGRYDPAKNHSTIFRVAQKLKSKLPSAHFVFCGQGTDTTAFADELIKHNIEDTCQVLGVQQNIADVLKSFDVFIFPSVTEGQPNALIEAMLANLPVIASNINPIREATPDKLHSLLVPAMDVDAYIEVLTLLVNDEIDPEKFRCREFALLKFDPEKNFQEFVNVLQSGK